MGLGGNVEKNVGQKEGRERTARMNNDWNWLLAYINRKTVIMAMRYTQASLPPTQHTHTYTHKKVDIAYASRAKA